jgi:murein tripeptide amidase MpaA
MSNNITNHPDQETMHKVIVIRGQEHYFGSEYDAISTYLPTKIIGDDTVVHTVTDEQLAGLKAT